MNYSLFKKPSRYIGNEVNITCKDADIKTALCFPDTYEIGMSHLGLKILYSIINNIPDASAERVYAPWVDLEEYLREKGIPLSSLEHQRPLKDFDIIGFTLQYELSYTNILNMLDLGGIPLKAADRENDFPLIIAGGPCSVNPLPLVPFIDAFVIGDGEEVIVEIIGAYRKTKDQKPKIKFKEGLLLHLSEIEGIYVPSVHDTSGQTVRRRIVNDLDGSPFPEKPLLPYTRIVHDRVTIEISRGCTKGCRFCQAGMIYRPLRERSPENVLSLARKSIASTGYEEISFTSLSTGDYSGLLPLIKNFNRMCEGSHISVSLPSLRVGSINDDILKEIKSVRKTGFTIAPEAGTKRLRNVINKDYTDEEYNEALIKLFTGGWSTIKLYFMIGLPTETMEDIEGLIDMAVTAAKKGRQITGKRVNINVGISVYVPKPHTPFQWAGQSLFAEMREKQDYIRRAFRKRRVNFKGQHVENSLMEAVFSRADRKSALLLEEAWRLGCRFDAWSEHFNFENWLHAAENTGIDLYAYASRTLDPDEELPWDFIDTGINKNFLRSEYKKALGEKITEDCSVSCGGCGLDCNDRQETEDRKQTDRQETEARRLRPVHKISVPGKMRVEFSKTGVMRYLSHQELMTSIQRSIARARVPVAYSTGFHPHPKISFGPALSVGIEGLNEFFDIEITAVMTASDLLKRLNDELPQGLKALSTALVPLNQKALNDLISCYEYALVIDKSREKHINSFMQLQSLPVAREKKTVDIRPMVKKAELHGESLHIVLSDTESAKVRVFEILKEMLKMTTEEVQVLQVKRTDLFGYDRIEEVCI